MFITGFSRGAYTARALGGMIAAKGLLDPTRSNLADKERAYKLGTAAWYEYRRAVMQANAIWLEKLEDTLLDIPGVFTKLPSEGLLIAAPIEAIAVWDTVGAMGIPAYTKTLIRIDAFRFADKTLNPIVQHGIHAIAVDERREDFTPTLWDSDPRIRQVLFPGAHADVGGGYPESGLSDITLEWMTRQLASLGVLFAAAPIVVPQPDPTGVAHQPWLNSPWDMLPRGDRVFPAGLCLSESVLIRIAHREAPYAPANLTAYLYGNAAV